MQAATMTDEQKIIADIGQTAFNRITGSSGYNRSSEFGGFVLAGWGWTMHKGKKVFGIILAVIAVVTVIAYIVNKSTEGRTNSRVVKYSKGLWIGGIVVFCVALLGIPSIAGAWQLSKIKHLKGYEQSPAVAPTPPAPVNVPSSEEILPAQPPQ